MSVANQRSRRIPAWARLLAYGVGGMAVAPLAAPAASHIAAAPDAEGRVIYINAFTSAGSPPRLVPFSLASPAVRGFIQQAADQFQLDPGLLRAVVRVESDDNPRAVSRKGACGLMQLIPATSQRFGVADPFDPRQNIEGGANYLRYLLDRFSGSVPHALAAYNAGERSVVRSVARDGGLPRIPETEDYVRRVTALYQGSRIEHQGSGPYPALPAAVHGVERPKPELAIYRYVDAQGVTHFEQ